MLPKKIKTQMLNEFGIRLYQFTEDSIMDYLTDYDTKDNIRSAINASSGSITKINFKHPNGKFNTTFTNMVNKREIIRIVRRDGSLNYHDYLTVFRFRTDHPIYDLIVNVSYRYVYI